MDIQMIYMYVGTNSVFYPKGLLVTKQLEPDASRLKLG